MGNEMLNLLYREERKALDAMREEFDQLQEWRKKEMERMGKLVDGMAEQLKREVNRFGRIERLFCLSAVCLAAILLLLIYRTC